jgi:site-specific recombinase XerC
MAKITAIIKSDYTDKNNESRVVLQYSHLYKTWKYNTGIRVDPSYAQTTYDDDLEIWKLTGTRKLKPSERKKVTEANEALRQIYMSLSQTILDLKTRSLSLAPSCVKQEFLKAPIAKIDNRHKSAMTWYEEFIKAKEKEIGAGINSYRSTFEHLNAFTAKKGVVHLQDLTKDFLEKFRDHLDNLKLEGPTVHKQFKNLRIFLNWIAAQDENDEIKIPSAYKRFKVKARYGDPIGLTVNQFFQFYEKDLSKRPLLERTRDVFAFGVSIGGPRHGDLKRLADTLKRNGFKLDRNTITYFEGKTGNAHQEITLNKIGLQILAKYNFVMPKVPSNQRMNKNLKEIAKLLDWNEIKYIPKYDNYGKLLKVEEFALKEIFSTKFMRKTAATIDNIVGVPTKTSMKRTGHKTFAAYSRYVDVNKDSMLLANKRWDSLVQNKLRPRKKTKEKAVKHFSATDSA